MLVHYGRIDQTDRSRVDFGELEELASSIQRLGLIHPPTVSVDDNGSIILIGGGRRIAAMRLLGCEEIPVIRREQLTAHEIAEMEAEENFNRKNMTWQENALLIARTHELKVIAGITDDSWTMKRTGALFGLSAASVSHCTQIRQYLISGDEAICNAPSIKAAYDILLKRREDQAAALSAQMTVSPKAVLGNFQPIGDLNALLDGPSNPDVFSSSNLDSLLGPAPQKDTILDQVEFEISKMVLLGDCLTIMPQLNEGSVDHIVTDPPYGIDLDNLDTIKNLDTVVDTHDREQNISMFEPFLEQSYRLLKESGFVVLWYDMDHHNRLQDIATKIGFTTQRWPIVWHKLHPCRNNAPKKNFTKNVEFAMLLRKGKAALVEPSTTCVVAADGSVDRKMYDNPFAKPAAAWRFILEKVAFKGQIVFDPYLGQGSSALAAIDLGLTPMGCEIDSNHFNRAINNIKGKLSQITNNKATFK
jgi:site-specific DNA-methyltransferase (adenine-specific)